MKIKIIYTLFFSVALAALFLGNSSGRAGSQNAGNTGAPGDQEQSSGVALTCQTCHNGPIGTTMNVQAYTENTQDAVTQYTGGETYDIVVTINVVSGNAAAYGFQIVSLLDSNNSDTNGWSEPGNGVQIATASTTGRSYAEQMSPSNSNTFTVKWTAPASGAGDVTFYASGTAVDGGGSNSGDGGATTTFKMTETTVNNTAALNLDASMTLYPNPAVEQLNVDIQSAFSGTAMVDILDNQGRIVMRQSIDLMIGENTTFFDVNDLAAGFYLTRISHKNKLVSRPFVKY